MSFREITAWTSLITTGGVWGVYFALLWQDLQDRSLEPSAVGLFIGGVVVLAVVQIVIAIAGAIIAGQKRAEAPMDEREQLIDLKGNRAGFFALNAACFCASALWMAGVSPLVMANGILAAMVIGEVVRASTQIIGYRRGR